MKEKQKDQQLAIFSGQEIRRLWDKEEEKWYFSIIDIISTLTNSENPHDYWYKMKVRVKSDDGVELSTICRQLKFLAKDGKNYLSDAADTETIFRIIQSIPSPKAEPFKLWLARIGYERVEETEDPERAIKRAMATYLKKGYSEDWVNLRLKSLEIRHDLTNEWHKRGVKTRGQFAVLTDEITFAWAGLKVKDYKAFKDLKKENLRDNMTNLELVLNMLAETSTTEISRQEKPDNFEANCQVAKRGGGVAGKAKRELENQIGRPIISHAKSLPAKKKELK